MTTSTSRMPIALARLRNTKFYLDCGGFGGTPEAIDLYVEWIRQSDGSNWDYLHRDGNVVRVYRSLDYMSVQEVYDLWQQTMPVYAKHLHVMEEVSEAFWMGYARLMRQAYGSCTLNFRYPRPRFMEPLPSKPLPLQGDLWKRRLHALSKKDRAQEQLEKLEDNINKYIDLDANCVDSDTDETSDESSGEEDDDWLVCDEEL